MSLKDATAYNVQFVSGEPILIDTLSFEKYSEGEPWVAYRQFCQHFLAPLALMAYRHIELGKLSMIHIDGIPLELARSLLPMRTRLRPSMQIHIHLHSKFQDKYGSQPNSRVGGNRKFTRRAMEGLVDNLESAVKGLKWEADRTEWADYKNEDSYESDALDHKVQLIN